MKETLKTISERTGISTSTISRVLSGKAELYRISKETAEKVLEEAKKCNYAPNVFAQSLRTNKTSTIGVIIPLISSPTFFSELASGIISSAKEKNYVTVTVDSLEDPSSINDCLNALLARKVDGILAVACGNDSSMFEEINKNIVPVVLVDRYFENTKLPYVSSNNLKGAFDAVENMIQKGHKRIACIQGDPSTTPCRQRTNGYRQALKKYDLSDGEIIVGNRFSIRNGYLETKLLLNRDPRPTAIFVQSFTILLGVLKALKESSIKVPDDISLFSFDDNMALDYFTPPISRVSQSVEEMGRLAAKLLFEKIENRSNSVSQLLLSPELIMRDSVKILSNN